MDASVHSACGRPTLPTASALQLQLTDSLAGAASAVQVHLSACRFLLLYQSTCHDHTKPMCYVKKPLTRLPGPHARRRRPLRNRHMPCRRITVRTRERTLHDPLLTFSHMAHAMRKKPAGRQGRPKNSEAQAHNGTPSGTTVAPCVSDGTEITDGSKQHHKKGAPRRPQEGAGMRDAQHILGTGRL